MYADDTQLYVSLDPGNKTDVSSLLENLEHCTADIQLWIADKVSKLNRDKSSILYITSQYYSKSLNKPNDRIIFAVCSRL